MVVPHFTDMATEASRLTCQVTLSVVFWLQQMLFYINAGIFSPQMRILVTLLLLIPFSDVIGFKFFLTFCYASTISSGLAFLLYA